MSHADLPLSPADPQAPLAPGIAYDDIPPVLVGKVRTPRDAGYEQVRSTYVAQGQPGLVILAQDADDVVAGVQFAATQQAPLAIRSGGYGVSRTSTNDGGIVLDLSQLNTIEVIDEDTRRLRIGVGATWGMVSQTLAERGWSMTAGNAGDVGVGGLASGAGIGWLVRRYGLAIDHVVAADVVLADGSLVHVDAEQHPDLFWSVRGAGGALGVITALEMTALDVADIMLGVLLIDATDTAQFVERWFASLEQAPRELTTFVNLQVQSADQPTVAQVMSVWCGQDEAAALHAIAPLLRLGPVLDQQAQLIPYHALVPSQNVPLTGQMQIRQRNGFLPALTASAAQAVAQLLASPDVLQVELRSLGGAVGDVPADATAFAHRNAQAFLSVWFDPQDNDAVDALWEQVAEHFSGIYAALSSDTRPAAVRAAYPPATYDRLLALKQTYDPGNLFNPHMFPDLTS